MTKQFSLSKYIKGDILLILKGPHTRPQALLTSMKKRFCKVFALLNLREKWWVKIVITLFLISCNNINQPEKKLVEKRITNPFVNPRLDGKRRFDHCLGSEVQGFPFGSALPPRDNGDETDIPKAVAKAMAHPHRE